jgi:hypothetical protein
VTNPIVADQPGNSEHPAPDDESLGVELARFRLPGEGPRRMVAILRTTHGAFVFRGDGQTRQEADRKAAAKAAAFILANWPVDRKTAAKAAAFIRANGSVT